MCPLCLQSMHNLIICKQTRQGHLGHMRQSFVKYSYKSLSIYKNDISLCTLLMLSKGMINRVKNRSKSYEEMNAWPSIIRHCIITNRSWKWSKVEYLYMLVVLSTQFPNSDISIPKGKKNSKCFKQRALSNIWTILYDRMLLFTLFLINSPKTCNVKVMWKQFILQKKLNSSTIS